MTTSESPPEHRQADAPPPSVVLPRALIFLASIWLIGSWVIAIGLKRPVQPSSSSYEPGVRLMLICLTTGLMVGWPMLRLSQVHTPLPVRQTILDLVVLLSMVQVVLWPLRLVTTWPVMRTAAIDATITGWLLIFGAVIAAAIGTDRRGPRNLAMVVCIGLCLAGPALAWVGLWSGVRAFNLIELSPLMAVKTLGEGGGGRIRADQWQWIGLLCTGGGAVWLALLGWALFQRVRSSEAG
jgi:hypothetical protein